MALKCLDKKWSGAQSSSITELHLLIEQCREYCMLKASQHSASTQILCTSTTLSQARAEQSIAHLVDSASYNNQQSLPSLPHLYATRAHPQFAIFFLTHCTRSSFQVVWIQKCCRSCLLAISLIAGSLFRVDWIWHLATAWHVAVYEYFFARITSSN